MLLQFAQAAGRGEGERVEPEERRDELAAQRRRRIVHAHVRQLVQEHEVGVRPIQLGLAVGSRGEQQRRAEGAGHDRRGDLRMVQQADAARHAEAAGHVSEAGA